MAFASAKAFFKDGTANNTRVLIRAQETIPAEFVKRYKKNVVDITPRKTGALRRSIITQQLGDSAQISWRSPYAKAQNEGGHNVRSEVRGRIRSGDRVGRFGIIPPGYYRYKNYTTAGTGPRFAFIAFQRTQAEMPAVLRELGLTK